MVNKSKKKKNNVDKAVAAGVTVAALTAAGYVLFGPDGKKNRRKINSWAVKMKGEIIEKFEEAKELTEPVYHDIVDEVASKYAVQAGVSKKELQELVAEMKKYWKHMVRDAKRPARKIVKKTKPKAKPKAKTGPKPSTAKTAGKTKGSNNKKKS